MGKIINLILQHLPQSAKQLSTHPTALSYLIHQKIIEEEELVDMLTKALRYAKLSPLELDELPSTLQEKVLKSFAKLLNIDYIDLDTFDIEPSLTQNITSNLLRKYLAIPIHKNGTFVDVVMADPLDIEAQDAIQRLFPHSILRRLVAPKQQIENIINKLEINGNVKEYIQEIRKDLQNGVVSGDDVEDSSAIMKLIDTIIYSCISSRASDIHIEPTQHNCLVRARIDGILTEKFLFDKDIYPPLASRIKLLANLDIAEKRNPQDGRFSQEIMGKEYDFRVSTLPIVTGESIVMRILDKTKALIPLEEAGMSEKNFSIFTKAIKKPYGIILVTGPTGSGKSTTLYGALNMLRSVEKKIITVEDPVEYKLNLIQQVQINPKIGFDFAKALRAILRQDPDIVMIGEIRDQETLRIATQAALTGHLVLSTLHTNDAVSSINRMIDMGIEPYLISGALLAIEAQRLVRKLCPHCKTPVQIDTKACDIVQKYLSKDHQFYKGKGCKYCDFTGYKGREMICEILEIDEEISSVIAHKHSQEEILKKATEKGFEPMIKDGLLKAASGITTIDEVLRVTRL